MMILLNIVLGQNLQIVEDSEIVEPQDEPEQSDESSGVIDEVINTEETSLIKKD